MAGLHEAWMVHCVLSNEADGLSKLPLSSSEMLVAMPCAILSAMPLGAQSTVSSIASAGTHSEEFLKAAGKLYLA